MSTQITTSEVIRDTLNRLYALRENVLSCADASCYEDIKSQDAIADYDQLTIYIKTLVVHMHKIDSAMNSAIAYIVQNELN